MTHLTVPQLSQARAGEPVSSDLPGGGPSPFSPRGQGAALAELAHRDAEDLGTVQSVGEGNGDGPGLSITKVKI